VNSQARPVTLSGMPVGLVQVGSSATPTRSRGVSASRWFLGNRHSPRYLFDRRTRAEGSAMFGRRNHGGDARKPASPNVEERPVHPAAPARATPTAQPRRPVDGLRPVRWIGRYLDR
jgi:hypothetical protein